MKLIYIVCIGVHVEGGKNKTKQKTPLEPRATFALSCEAAMQCVGENTYRHD